MEFNKYFKSSSAALMIRRLVLGISVIPFVCLFVLPSAVQAQTVFIPTFRNFTYNGSVSVPDGGTIQLGSVNSTGEQANSSGVPGLSGIPGVGRGFKNRSISREQQAGSLTAKAEILIMEELEAQHLAKAGYPADGVLEQDDVARKAQFITQHIGKNPNWSGSSSDAGRAASRLDRSNRFGGIRTRNDRGRKSGRSPDR